MPPISTYVFFDFGTTGLLDENPEITELHMSAVTTRELRRYFKDGGEEYFEINNLHCRLEDGVMVFQGTEHRDPEECDLEDEITDFLNGLEKPLCLIAYNGPKFDFPLLRSELAGAKRFSAKGILCADAMAAFYDIMEPESEKTSYAARALNGSFPWPYQVGMKRLYRFKDVCKKVLGVKPEPNNAKVRNKAMVRISLRMSYEFMLWVAENNFPFTSVYGTY